MRNELLNKMKNKESMKYLLLILLVFVVITPVYAAPGAGLVYGIESAIIDSNKEVCVDYGLYNPFDVDSEISLAAEGELAEFVKHADIKFVPAGISKEEAYTSKICFRAPDLRTKTCKIPFILCRYDCNTLEKIYEGQVLASPNTPSDLAGSGSAVGMSIAAPFTLLVRCTGEGYDYIPLILIIIGVVVLILTIILLRKRTHRHERDKTQRRFDQWQQYQQQPPYQSPPVQQPPQYPQQPVQPTQPPQYLQPQQPQPQQPQPQQPQPQQLTQQQQPATRPWQPPQY